MLINTRKRERKREIERTRTIAKEKFEKGFFIVDERGMQIFVNEQILFYTMKNYRNKKKILNFESLFASTQTHTYT
jgi:hypothetical protein